MADENKYAEIEEKKFLDAAGLTYFASLLGKYPTNEILATVINAIQDALDDKMDAKGITDNTKATPVSGADANLITARTLYNAGYTKNIGTITEIIMNGISMGKEGVVNLGDVVRMLSLASEETPGIAKPGYGLEVTDEGAFNVQTIDNYTIHNMYGNTWPYSPPEAAAISAETVNNMYINT